MKLPPELRQVDAMLCRFSLPNEDYRNIPAVALVQFAVIVDVDFVKDRAEFAEQWRDSSFGFFAEMTARTCVERDVTRPASGKLRISQ